MSEPQIIQCVGDCTVTVVHQFALPVLDMSTGDASVISGAVLLVWAAGFVFRALIRTLNTNDGNSTYESEN